MRLTEIATHIAGIAIDRQRQQEVLRERDARINLAAESAELAFWVLYPQQGAAWISDKGRRIYGFDSNLPLTCELILSRVHPDERAAVKAEYDRACSLHGAFESEHRLLLPYGKTRWVIMRGRCLQDEHGNLLETIGVTLDVSPQKQAALQLQVQREEMAHRNRVALMGEMTASFAHELNQPLTAIANNASAARRFLEHGNTDPVLLQELLQDMVADSQRAGEVIRGIRSLVRKEPSVHTLVDLNSVITDTVRLVSSDVLNRESVVTTQLDPHLPQVQAALVQIQQVLLNLIINASDAEANEVCLLDDDLSVLKSMQYLLASEGFKIRPFNKPEDFLAHASSHRVPVLVTDIWMDRVTGLEVLARLCAISPKTHVIVITAREDLAARATAMAIGPVAFFMKPFDDEKFIAAVRDALNRA